MWFVLDLVGNPKECFFGVAAHLILSTFVLCTHPSSPSIVDTETGRERSDLSERTETTRSSVTPISGVSSMTGLDADNKKTFMTEASIAKSVTIVSPTKEGRSTMFGQTHAIYRNF